MSLAQLQMLGDYEILQQLGEGMLGKVYLARHRFLKKLFTIKVFPEELGQNKSFIERFEQIVSLLGTLDHPNILKIQNVSCDADTYFLVSDAFAEASNLAQYKKKKILSEEEVLKIVRQVAAALDHAHQKNFGDEPLAHRGLKLNNILVGKGLEVKVTDFGLSKICGIGACLAGTYKQIWERLYEQGGKLYDSFSQYYNVLAPEQRRVEVSTWDADAKADVYAFGVIVYYLLCGFYPEGLFPMPSECRELKWQWDDLVKACLNYDPEKRPITLMSWVGGVDRSESLKPMIKPQELKRPEYEEDPGAVFETNKAVEVYTPKKQETKEVAPSLTEMVVIEGGTFLRGSHNGARDEMPRHAVHLSSFAIDIHPVMNEQFVLFLAAMGGEKDANNCEIIRLRDSRIRKQGGKYSIESGYGKHPVVGVTWYGALAYAKWIGKRLPTEAEWEIAAYGGLEGAQYPTGDSLERPQANFFSSDTTAVMSYPPNEYGLYDMAGNVYEWCGDWYGYHYYETSMQEPDNPQGPPQGVYRVLRGGCWKSLKEDMRCSHRHRNNPGIMNGTYGFRCAADVI